MKLASWKNISCRWHCHAVYFPALQRRGVDTSSLTVASLEPSAVSHVAAKYYPQIEDLDLLEKQLLQRMDALREMMSGDAKAQPQGEGEVPEKVKYINLWVRDVVCT